jgi:hypothetical protein
MHYASSYSLEILYEQLKTTFDVESIAQEFERRTSVNIENKHHDALFDCFTTFVLIQYFIQRTFQLVEKYQQL